MVNVGVLMGKSELNAENCCKILRRLFDEV